MAQSRFFRRLGALLVLAAAAVSMVLPAFALFDMDDNVTGETSLPIAENFSLTTYRDVAVSATFSAVDPEGDALTFRVTKNPARGSVTLAEEGSARFTYTPYENKTGKDSFTYVAVDGAGNVSQPAVVSVKIQKPNTKVTYADMDGDPAHKAAIALAEKEIFVGEKLGESWFFRPDTPVTREEFLAMAMDVVGMETLPEAVSTGFADDGSISVWAKPYVASALRAGMIQGTGAGLWGAEFSPDQAITGIQAAVMLNRLLRVSDVAAQGDLDQDAAPAWAYQSVVNLEAVGVLPAQEDGSPDLSGTLTRGQAAQMLLAAMEVLDFRDRIW